MILAIGSLGLVLLIIAFTLSDIGQIKQGGRLYNLLNLFGSLALIVYSYDLHAYIFLILETFWFFISLFEFFLGHPQGRDK